MAKVNGKRSPLATGKRTYSAAATDGILSGEEHLDGYVRPVSPEVRLWQAVVAQAVFDSVVASNYHLRDSESGGCSAAFDPEVIRSESRRWCVAMIEPWLSAREDVCARAGLDPEFVRSIVRRRLDDLKDADADRAEATRKATEEKLARKLDHLTARSPEVSDRRLDALLRQLAELEDRAF